MQDAAILLARIESQNFLWGILSIVFHLVLGILLSSVSKGKAKRVPALLGAKCWVCSYTIVVCGAEEAFPSPL